MNKKRVLILCTGNSCRSQMAEGFMPQIAADKLKVFSAGLQPTQVNPLAVEVMEEVGVDISSQRSKSAIEFIGQQFDYVITVCDNAKKSCPAFPGKYIKIHWELEDPALAQGSEDEKLAIFREIRDKIKELVIAFLSSTIK